MAGAAQPKVAGTSSWSKYGSGYLHDLSDEQKDILAYFTKKIDPKVLESVKAPHETTESVSARFLRARKYDLDKAIEMMTNCAAWRKKTNPRQFVGMLSSKVIDAHVSELQRFYPHAYVDLCDEQYRPVYFEKTGAIDTAGLLAITSQQKLLEWHMQMLEEFNQARMSACTQIRKDDDGRVTEALTNVFDAEGLTLGMFDSNTRSFLSAISKIDSDNYPETLGKLLIINAPFVFHTIWSVVSTFLDERTLSKIKVVGTDYKKDLFELLGGEQNVPTEYGGKLKVPGGLYPKGSPDITIHSGKAKEIRRKVPKGHSFRVRWISRPADIEFSAHLATGKAAEGLIPGGKQEDLKESSTDKSGMQELYGLKGHPGSDAKMVEISGVSEAEDGVLVATWDNSKGWSQRVVIYTLTVTAPGAVEEGTQNDIVRCGHLAGPKSKAMAAILAEGVPGADPGASADPGAATGGAAAGGSGAGSGS